MILAIVLIILGLISGWGYLFAKEKLHFDLLLISIWLIAIGVAQFRLSPLERPWTINFWLLLLSSGIFFILSYRFGNYLWNKYLTTTENKLIINHYLFLIILGSSTFLTLIANFYIFKRFGTLPLISSIPDKMRFIINREVFGPIEYAALLPRIYIPLSFLYLVINQKIKKKTLWLIIINIIIGLIFLLFYASRLTIVITILLCYFGYLAIKIKELSSKKLITTALVTIIIVLVVSITIPIVRQFITYKDYQYEGEYNPFNYITSISQINLPSALQFLIPLYLIPAFNLQALMRSLEIYQQPSFYGGYSLSVFDSLLKIFNLPQFNIKINWGEIFVPWWNTATFLFNYLVDFGWWGIYTAVIIWGLILSLIYVLNKKRPSLLTAFLLSYFSFVVIMTIYTNYFNREELYLDLILFFLISFIINFNKKLT